MEVSLAFTNTVTNSKMVFEMVCLHNKFGFCKFGHTCHKRHVDVICEKDCDTQDCQRRHPRPCKFLLNYNRCKFDDYCKYKHENKNVGNDAKSIEDEKMNTNLKIFEKQIILLQEKHEKVVAEVKYLKEEILKMKTENEKLKQVENIIDTEGDKSHSDDNIFKCSKCSYDSKTDKQLLEHISMNHEEHHLIKVPHNVFHQVKITYVSESF